MSKATQRSSSSSSITAICVHIKDHLIECVADFFAWWAGIVYDHPYRCIAGTLGVVLLCCIGFIPGIPKWVDGAEALYSLPFSMARSEGNVHRTFFNETRTRPTFVLVTGKTPGENVLTWPHLEAVRQLDRLIRGQAVDVKRRRIGIARKPEYGASSIPSVASSSFPKDKPEHELSSDLGSNITIGTRDAPEAAHRMVEFMNNGAERNAQRGDAGADVLTFQDICDRNPFEECSVSSVLEMGVFDIRKMQPDHEPSLFVFDGVVYNLHKRAFPPHYFLGKAKETPCIAELPIGVLRLIYNESRLYPGSKPGVARADAMCINEAKAFQLVYELIDKEEYRARNEAWEKAFVEVLNDNMEYGPLKITMNAFRSRDDALRSSTSESSDILFVGLTFGFIILYSSGLNFSCDLYKSKAYPALSGVVAAILGMIAGMGFISLCNISFVPTALVCPFLVVGVGTDDMFVIINSYSMAYMVDSARDRCILSLRDTGLAITLTTITSLVSFFIGLNTDYLSIKNFCYFCGAGMFFGYIFVLTFFFAFHCLDAQREQQNNACLFCSATSNKETSDKDSEQTEVSVVHGADISTFTLGALMVRRAEHNALRNYANRLRARRLAITSVSSDPEEGDQNGILSSISQLNDQASQATRGSSSPLSDIAGSHRFFKSGQLTGLKSISDLSADLKETNLRTTCSDKQHFNGHRMQQKKSWFSRTRDYLYNLYDKIPATSDYLLSRIALEGHNIGLKRPIEQTPSNGIFRFQNKYDDIATPDATEILLQQFVNQPQIPLYYHSLRTGEKKVFINEPRGSVGRQWRRFLIRYYGPFIMYPATKAIVLLSFALFTAISLYGCTRLQTGLELKDLAPIGSYLNHFDKMQAEYFGEYDFPVDIFFPDRTEWWTPAAHKALRELQDEMLESGSGKFVTNPLLHMLDDEELKPFLQSGKREEFQSTLHAALMLEKGKYKQFEQNFVWEGDTLRAWKMQILPAGMTESSERASWMAKIRKDCREQAKKIFPLRVMSWNYMMTYYESDLQINSSVTTNMIVAALTMFVIAIIGIPELLAGFLVTVVMAMIDVGIIGFMYFWDVRLNMVSMICLLIAVGFSVDFSAHVCHTFMETEGQSRDQRAIETLVLMGNPVFHGAASSILGVLMLGFSQSYIFRVFFKMMTMVMVFALIHSVVFLPVLLSLIGDPLPHYLKKGHGKSLPTDSSKPVTHPASHSNETPSSLDSSVKILMDDKKLQLGTLRQYEGDLKLIATTEKENIKKDETRSCDVQQSKSTETTAHKNSTAWKSKSRRCRSSKNSDSDIRNASGIYKRPSVTSLDLKPSKRASALKYAHQTSQSYNCRTHGALQNQEERNGSRSSSHVTSCPARKSSGIPYSKQHLGKEKAQIPKERRKTNSFKQCDSNLAYVRRCRTSTEHFHRVHHQTVNDRVVRHQDQPRCCRHEQLNTAEFPESFIRNCSKKQGSLSCTSNFSKHEESGCFKVRSGSATAFLPFPTLCNDAERPLTQSSSPPLDSVKEHYVSTEVGYPSIRPDTSSGTSYYSSEGCEQPQQSEHTVLRYSRRQLRQKDGRGYFNSSRSPPYRCGQTSQTLNSASVTSLVHETESATPMSQLTTTGKICADSGTQKCYVSQIQQLKGRQRLTGTWDSHDGCNTPHTPFRNLPCIGDAYGPRTRSPPIVVQQPPISRTVCRAPQSEGERRRQLRLHYYLQREYLQRNTSHGHSGITHVESLPETARNETRTAVWKSSASHELNQECLDTALF